MVKEKFEMENFESTSPHIQNLNFQMQLSWRNAQNTISSKILRN